MSQTSTTSTAWSRVSPQAEAGSVRKNKVTMLVLRHSHDDSFHLCFCLLSAERYFNEACRED